MRWTSAQEKTITTRDKNILVSAAAGSGKTTVLIERIKQLVLEDHVDIDRFLITTFTNAAAAEMKEKMEKAIHGELDQMRAGAAAKAGAAAMAGGSAKAGGSAEEQERYAFLQKQLQLLPTASISTFHTFSLGIMRDFFYLTDLQPGFIIGDETRLQIMQRDSVDEVFERRFEEDADAFKAFLRKYSGDRSDERLKDQVLDIYKKIRSIPRYMDWAKEQTEAMRSEDPVRALGIDRFLIEESYDMLGDAIHWFDAAAQVLHKEETEGIYLKARQDVEKVEQIRQLAGDCREDDLAEGRGEDVLEALTEALQGFKANTMRASGAEKDAYDAVKEDVSWLRDRGKKCIDDLKKKYFSQSLEEAGEVLRDFADDTAYFIGLVEETEQVYRRRKGDQNLVDFDDCMHYAIEILEDENAAADYRERFEYIFIDEYQDSNMLQEEIIGRIARENNLFMVGDVKQSIYKFRLAEPEIFRDRYEEYRSGRDENSIRIDLNNNFRSRRTIRDAVNRIFEVIMDGYDDDAALHGPEDETGPAGYPVSLHILSQAAEEEEPGAGFGETGAGPGTEGTGETGDQGADDDVLEELTEAEVIAGIIRQTLGQPIMERDGSQRPAGYGDIAVLSRGGAAIPQIERFLNNEGIPSYGETDGGYYETVEIQVFMNFLRVISNMNQDVPLISVMSSVVFDFSPRQLAQIRIEYRDGSFYSAVRRYAEQGSDEAVREKIGRMLDQIALWKEIARTLPLDELMRRLLYETGYYDYCSGLPTGRQRTSNLRLLLQKGAAYEETSHMGLYGFLAYVEAMRRTNQKVSEASLVGEGKDVVRIMTVHKSKGLEFPVVILAGAGKQIVASSDGKAPAMHKDFAVALPEVHTELRWSRKSLLQKVIAGKHKREGLEEEIRILYVALTRPMQKLAIVGSVKDVSKLQPFVVKKSYLEMIYGTMCELAADPAAAEVIVHRPGEVWPAGEPVVAGAGAAKPDGVAAGVGAAEPGEEPGAAAAGVAGAAEPATAAGEVAGAGVAGAAGAGSEIDPEEIDRRLSFVYPYQKQQKVKTKYSVTELSKQKDGSTSEAGPKIPGLLDLPLEDKKEQQKKLSANEIGTAMHTCMERIDFAAALEQGEPYIRQEVDRLLEQGILTPEEREAIRPEHLAEFFGTEIGARAAKAPMLCREKEFLLQKEIEGMPTIVQGVIDCYFEDEQGLVLIDYKNSWARDEAAEQVLIERYEGQIRLYAEALEAVLGRPVSEAWLYLFKSRRFIRVEIAG